MNSRLTTTITCYAFLGAAAAISFLLPEKLVVEQTYAAPATGDTIIVPGTVRDFHKTNAGIATPPSAGNAHYAGNVQLNLNAQLRPAYAGTGFKVASQWRNADHYPIAPHMFRNATQMRTVRLVNAPTINNNPTVDTFDSTMGAYGPANKGPAPTFAAGQAMPLLSEPTGMPALVAEYLRDGAGTTVLNTDINCNKFLIRNSRILQINGARRVLVHEEMMIENFAKIQLLPNASLQIWVKKDATIKNNIDFNLSTGDPSRLTIYNLGTNDFTIENSAATYMNMVAPNGGLHVKNSGQFCGQYLGKSITIDNGCGVHIDTRGATGMCGVEFADIAGTAGPASNGGIPSAAAFDTWYVDIPGTNMSGRFDVELTKNSSGVYEYLNSEFHPVDGILFGNEGQSHNNYFTFSFSVQFKHKSCDDRFFEFQGADDAWMFVDGQLAMDLGGVMPGTAQRVDFDRLGLTDGATYTLYFFYAQRNTSVSMFRMRTNLDLIAPTTPITITASAD
jgi:fibro-slime domain-containing protein